jgi:hypothetical protein
MAAHYLRPDRTTPQLIAVMRRAVVRTVEWKWSDHLPGSGGWGSMLAVRQCEHTPPDGNRCRAPPKDYTDGLCADSEGTRP